MYKKYFLSILTLMTATSLTLDAVAQDNSDEPMMTVSSPVALGHDISDEIPSINEQIANNFIKVSDVAQYGGADWSQAIGIARGITVKQAMEIANENPEITYFFYTKGYRMILSTGRADGSNRVFLHGDTVFFSGEPGWGTAPGLADGYIKQ